VAVQTPTAVAASSRARPTSLLRDAARLLWRHPWVLTAVLCAVLLVLPVTGGDLAAQEFHTWVLGRRGALLWNDYWYGGHLLAGYSLLAPPLAAVVGTRLLGAIGCVAAAAAASSILTGTVGAEDPYSPTGRAARLGARLGALWFAVGCVGSLIVGQVPFGVGAALALAAWLAVMRRHPWWAAFAALAASLASPLAGAFLLMGAVAWCLDIGVRRAAPLATAVAGIAMASLIGGGGFFPFPRRALLTVLIFVLGGMLLVPRRYWSLRAGIALYGLSSVVVFLIHSPVGGNMGRLGALFGGPLAVAVLARRRLWKTLVVLAVPLLAWQVWPMSSALTRSTSDPSSHASYFTGLTAFLRTQDVADGRVEVPNLIQHWESYYVAKAFPLSRGWERQIDLRYNEVLYHPDLTAEQLHAWMVRSGVGLVAVPDAAIDYWSQREVALIDAGQPWLQPVWSDAHWRVWRLTDSPGLVTGPATMTHLGVDSFTLSPNGSGPALVRVHWSPYWRVTSGSACVAPGAGGWTTVDIKGTGPVVVTASWSLAAAVRPSHAPTRCPA
jgi:hypothetical protein